MKDRKISVTDAARRFSDLVNRVYYRGESATLFRGGLPVARLVPPVTSHTSARDLAERWANLPHLRPDEASSLDKDLKEARRRLPRVDDSWG